MMCEGLRTTVSLAVARCPVWTVNHLYGPFPTTYTWGYYRSDVACVFGNRFDKAYIARLHAGTRLITSAEACRGVRPPKTAGRPKAHTTHAHFHLHNAVAWLTFRKCFHAHLNDPRTPPSARTTDMVLEPGTGLTNVVLWDLAFIAFSQSELLNSNTTYICMQLWAHFARYSDPNGPTGTELDPGHNSSAHHATHTASAGAVMGWHERAVTWQTDGLGQHLTIRYTAQPFTEPYLMRPYLLQQKLRGCIDMSHSSETMYTQQNLTGLHPQKRRAAIKLGNYLIAADQGHLAEEEELHEQRDRLQRQQHPRHRRRRTDDLAVVETVAVVRHGGGVNCLTSDPLLHIRLARGADVSLRMPHSAAGQPRGS